MGAKSAEASGRRRLKSSMFKNYLRAHSGSKVDMLTGCADWYVEDWNGTVVFKAVEGPARYLRAHPDGRMDLVDRPHVWGIWTPLKNYNGTWSFRSFHGYWMSPFPDGSVKTVHNCDISVSKTGEYRPMTGSFEVMCSTRKRTKIHHFSPIVIM